MMTSRERVLASLHFQPVDRIAKDLGGMRSTGISCFAYPHLVKALGLPERLPKIYDNGQMLALPDPDVLDALGCDVAEITCPLFPPHALFDTNAFADNEHWNYFDFYGRLPALVRNPSIYSKEGKTIYMHGKTFQMPPESYVFDCLHAGQPLILSGDLPKEDLDHLKERLTKERVTPEHIQKIATYCAQARRSTSRAIFFNGFSAGLGFHHGIATWSMLCLLEPDYVRSYHRILIDHAIYNIRQLLPAIRDFIDILLVNADDQGTQQNSILPPDVFWDLYGQFYRELNDEIHYLAPNVKTFLHSCGAIYPLIPKIIDAGFDILNPVQWTAGSHSYQAWKDLCRKRLVLWGGGVNTQVTLPFGSLDKIREEVQQVVSYLAQDSGYVFCAIHNLLAEISPEKILTIYRTVDNLRIPN